MATRIPHEHYSIVCGLCESLAKRVNHFTILSSVSAENENETTTKKKTNFRLWQTGAWTCTAVRVRVSKQAQKKGKSKFRRQSLVQTLGTDHVCTPSHPNIEHWTVNHANMNVPRWQKCVLFRTEPTVQYWTSMSIYVHNKSKNDAQWRRQMAGGAYEKCMAVEWTSQFGKGEKGWEKSLGFLCMLKQFFDGILDYSNLKFDWRKTKNLRMIKLKKIVRKTFKLEERIFQYFFLQESFLF